MDPTSRMNLAKFPTETYTRSNGFSSWTPEPGRENKTKQKSHHFLDVALGPNGKYLPQMCFQQDQQKPHNNGWTRPGLLSFFQSLETGISHNGQRTMDHSRPEFLRT